MQKQRDLSKLQNSPKGREDMVMVEALKQAFLAHEQEEDVDEPEESGAKAQEREGGRGKAEESEKGAGGGRGKGGQRGEGKASAEVVKVDLKEEIKVRRHVCTLAHLHIHTRT